MLNISENKSQFSKTLNRFQTVKNLENRPHYKILNKIIAIVSVFGVICLMLPWTQNISGSGAVTTLKPNQRPQTIQSVISGRIEKWFVKEGDFVKKGDTIMFISEIKEEYLDPNLVLNTKNQMNAKELALESYGSKVNVLSIQIQSIENEQELKIEQLVARNDLASLAAITNHSDLIVKCNNSHFAFISMMRHVFNLGLDGCF